MTNIGHVSLVTDYEWVLFVYHGFLVFLFFVVVFFIFFLYNLILN